jgi:hypothetical protein
MELAELKDEDLVNLRVKSAKPSFFRRKYLINPKVQIAYSMAAAWMILVTMGVSAMVVYYTISSILFDPTNQLAGHKALELAHSEIFKRLLWVGFLLVAGGVTLTIYFLHRLVGPVYRFEQVLRSATSGAIPPDIKLRKHDEFQDLANALIEMLNTIGQTPSGAYAVIQKTIKEVPEGDVEVESSGFAAQQPAEESEGAEGEEESAKEEEGESAEETEDNEEDASESEAVEADKAESDEGNEEEGDTEEEPANQEEQEGTESDDNEKSEQDGDEAEGESDEDAGKEKE